MIKPKVLKGFRDFLPEQEIPRQKIQRLLSDVFTSFGFVPIDTPILEYTEVLLGKGGGETDKQMYRFEDNGKRDVAMRFDLTVPFARYIAQHRNELYLPFKRYHMAKVFRGENTQNGRYREFMQCDFDIVGVDSVSADFEIAMIMATTLEKLEIPDFTINAAHRGIFNDLLEKLGIEEHMVAVLRMVDKLQKIGKEKVIEGLLEFINEDQANTILSFIQMEDSNQATIAKIEKLIGSETESIKRLKDFFAMVSELHLDTSFIYNPSITRGLDYYTGMVFETFLNELPKIGSVCSGGRYNDLANLYTKEQLPGVGASIGLDRLLAALDELGRSKTQSSETELIIFCMDDKYNARYHGIARELRREGVNTEVFPVSKKLPQQFKFAEKKEVAFGLLLGEDEFANGTFQLKDLVNRKNYDFSSVKEISQYIKYSQNDVFNFYLKLFYLYISNDTILESIKNSIITSGSDYNFNINFIDQQKNCSQLMYKLGNELVNAEPKQLNSIFLNFIDTNIDIFDDYLKKKV